MSDRLIRLGFSGLIGAVYVFLLAPLAIVVIASVNSGQFLRFPPVGFSLRWFASFFDSQPFMDALQISLKLALGAMIIGTAVGAAAALFVVRFAGRWREPLRLLIIAPLLLPETLTAIAILFFYYWVGIGTKSFAGLLAAHVLIVMPFAFLSISAALYNFDNSIEEAARSLGAGPLTTFRRVTLPIIKPGVIAGAMFGFIVSFDLFTVSLLLKGIGTTTLPIQLFDYIKWSFDPTAAAVSTVSIALTLAVVVVMEWLVGLKSLRF